MPGRRGLRHLGVGLRHLAITAALLCRTTARARTPSDPSPVSCSLDGLADYSRSLPFCDLMKQTRVFGSAQAPYDANCSVGADGWPAQDSFGLVFITLPAGTPPVGVLLDGIYTLYWVGATNATISFPASSVRLLNQTFDGASTTAFLEVLPAPDNNGQLWVGWRDAPGVKNISLLQPGCSLDDIHALSPSLVSLASHFDSLRFMDWVSTNDSPNADWAARRTLASPSYAPVQGNTSGIPWEACVKLANTVQRDMWINVPALATDDYIAQLATLLRDSVDPSLYIYYEYSNEVWNWQFSQATYNLRMANASVTQDGDPHRLDFDGCGNEGYWAWRRTAYMAKHIADVFKTVFGNDNVGAGKRVRPLLCGQVSWTAPLQTGLEYLEAVFGPPADFLHGICGAPYFNLGDAINRNANLTVDNVFTGFDESIFNQSLAFGVASDNPLAMTVALAYHYGLEMRAYEGGPDTSGPNLGEHYLEVKGNATVDPRIQTRVFDYLRDWYAYGRAMGPLNYFVAGATNLIDQYGVYGILFDMRLPDDSYKLKAVDQARTLPKPATPTAFVPLVPFVANCTRDMVGAARPIRPPYHCDYFGANATFDFFMQAASAGPVRVTAHVTTDPGVLNATMGVQVNNAPEVLVACPPTPSGQGLSDCDTAVLDAPAGVSVVRLRSVGWEAQFRAYAIYNVSFA
jgi:hypothetical protein